MPPDVGGVAAALQITGPTRALLHLPRYIAYYFLFDVNGDRWIDRDEELHEDSSILSLMGSDCDRTKVLGL